MSAEHPPQFLMPALADQVQVNLAKRGQVPVRVVDQQLARLATCSGVSFAAWSSRTLAAWPGVSPAAWPGVSLAA